VQEQFWRQPHERLAPAVTAGYFVSALESAENWRTYRAPTMFEYRRHDPTTDSELDAARCLAETSRSRPRQPNPYFMPLNWHPPADLRVVRSIVLTPGEKPPPLLLQNVLRDHDLI